LTFDNNDPDKGAFNFDVTGRVNVGGTFIVDDGNAGWAGAGFVQFTPQGYADDSDQLSDIHYSRVGSGNTASWTFDNLVPGNYRVSVSYPAHSNRSTASPFSVYDGTTAGTLRTPAPVTINQQQAPDDFSDKGVFWEDIGGGFQVTGANGNQLTVTLADITGVAGEAGVKYVIADAIRIERVLGPEIEVADLGGDGVAGGVDDRILIDGQSNISLTVFEGTPTTRQIRIRNVGTSDLNINNVTLANTTGSAFSVGASPASPITSGGSGDFTVTLDTMTEGSYAATVTIDNGDADEGMFTFTLTATISDVLILDNGQPGFSAPNFTQYGLPFNQPQGFQGDIHYRAATAQPDTATWTFSSLSEGMYQVSATWFAHSNRASDSPFTIDGDIDGAAVTVDVNQRQTPTVVGGGGAFNDQGVDWAPLGMVEVDVAGGSLQVSLGTALTGFVIADGIRLERLPPLLAEVAVAGDQSSVVRDPRSGGGVGSLTTADVTRVLETAKEIWTVADPSSAARLAGVTVQVADLPVGVLGLASGHQSRIWLDADAAGHGWEISGQRLAVSGQRSIDLLTVVTHELGHVLGLPDLDAADHPHEVMSGRLDVGVRRLPLGIEIAPDSVLTQQPALLPADRLFAGLGGFVDGEAGDELSDLGRARRDESLGMIQRELEPADSALEIDRLLDDEEDLFADLSDRRAERRDEESADQLFAELFDEPG
jgi:hypothetical protein